MDLRLSIELNEIVIETYDFGDGLLETKEGAPERIGEQPFYIEIEKQFLEPIV